MGLEKFYMAAHSFGGYIFGNYAIRHPERVKKLLLISPIGIRVKQEGENDWQYFKKKAAAFKQSGGNPPSLFSRVWVKSLWDLKASPMTMAQILGRDQTRKMICNYMCNRQSNCDQCLTESVQEFMYQMVMRPSSQECAIMVLFTQGLQALMPLGTDEKLGSPNLPFSVSFVYGTDDWMRYCDDDFGKECIKKTQTSKARNHFYLCPDSGHNLQMDNP